MIERVGTPAWRDTADVVTAGTVGYIVGPGVESTPASLDWYTPEPQPQLSAPLSFVGTPGNGKITWTWLPPADDGGMSITAYTLRVGGATIPLLATDRSYVESGLTNGTNYPATLTASNALGEGPAASASATPSATITKPGPVTSASATGGDGKVTATWQPPASDGGASLTGYIVKLGSGTAVTLGSGVLTYTWNGLTNGTAVSATIEAINASSFVSDPVTVTATPTAAVSLAAGHVPGTVMLGIASPQTTPRPGFAEARKIICLNKAGTLVRDVWLKRNFVKNKITTATITGMMDDGDAFGLYNVISFKYLTQVTKGTQIWNQVTNGSKDTELQVLADYAKSRRTGTASGVNKYFAAGIHHEPAGDGPLADWAAMQIYCSYFFAGYRRTAGTTGPYVYHADQDVRDIMAWCAIGNGNWWSPVDQTSINAAIPDTLVSTFKAHKHIVAADFYEPTGSGLTNASGYADVDWVPNRPASGKVELRVGNFIDDLKGRPGGCGALGIGEYNSVAQTGIDAAYTKMKANNDVFMFANFFDSCSGSKWEYRLIPDSYPQISGITLAEYPPGHEVGGTWMSEQKLNVFKKNLDDTLGKDSTDATRMTQWVSWPAP